MSAFLNGFSIGFGAGMFNRMFGGFAPFGGVGLGIFGGFNPYIGANPFCGCNNVFQPYFSRPVFMPQYTNFSVFTPYSMPYSGYSFIDFTSYSPQINNTTPTFNLPEYTTNPFSSIKEESDSNDIVSSAVKSVQSTYESQSSKSLTTQKFEAPKWSAASTIGDTFIYSSKKEDSNTSKASNYKKANAVKSKHTTKKTVAVSYKNMSDSEMRRVYGNYTKNITEKYTGTAADLNKYLKGKGVLEGKGQAFIDAQNTYGISASVLAAIWLHESANGNSSLAKNNNNVGGVRKNKTSFRKYSSVEACIDDMARFIKSGYADQNLLTLYQVNAKYCPVQDTEDRNKLNSGWATGVNRLVNDIEKA